MINLQATVRVLPLETSREIMLVSNDADCIEAAIDVVRVYDEVSVVEVADHTSAPQAAPSQRNDMARPQGPFKYRVTPRAYADRETLIDKMVNGIQGALNARDLGAKLIMGA